MIEYPRALRLESPVHKFETPPRRGVARTSQKNKGGTLHAATTKSVMTRLSGVVTETKLLLVE